MATRSIDVDRLDGGMRWRLCSAGSLAISSSDGRDATPRGRKARAILAYLACQPGTKVARERLAELLWGDRGEAQARASLRQALLEIHRAARGATRLLSADRTHVWIEPASVETDARDATPWAHSELPLFDDLNHITPEFDDWLAIERSRRSAALSAALRAEVERLLAKGRGTAALDLVDRMERIDPYDEDVLRLALQAEFQAGHPAAIERRFKDMDQRLRDEIGVTASSDSKALHDRLLKALAIPGETPEQAVGRSDAAGVTHPVRARRDMRGRIVAGAAITALAIGGVSLVTIGESATTGPRTIAVLPFQAGAGIDPDLTDGLSDELLSQLSRNSALRVTGRTSAWQYKGRAGDLRKVGRELRVDYLVEGSVRRAGGQMRVTVALVRARDASAIWSRVYAGTEQQAQPIQTAIGGAISGILGGAAPTGASVHRPSGEAYALYLRAKGLIRQRNANGLSTACNLLLEAVRIDPQFAAAWAQLGGAIRLSGAKDFPLEWGDPKSPRVTAGAAVNQALLLDPGLADGHAMMALIKGFDTLEGRAHLRRALATDPRNPQTLYWWGSAVAASGDYARRDEVTREAAALDPLWQRPVAVAAVASIEAGDRGTAERYLTTIKRGNPEGALDVETSIAIADVDFSKAVQLALGKDLNNSHSARISAALALISLGYVREGVLVGEFGSLSAALVKRQAPDRAALLRAARENAEVGGDQWFYILALWELARAGRYDDIAALYDARIGVMGNLDQRLGFNRQNRASFAGVVGLALAKIGRKADAARLFAAADEAGTAILAKGQVPPQTLVEIAANDAAMGRRDKAIGELQQAFAKGWRMYDMINGEIGEDPMFASLKGDARFERLRAISNAHRAKERREVAALGVV